MIEQGGPQLGSAARALLDAARDGLAPDAAAAARVKAKATAAAATGAAGAGVAIKLFLMGVVAVVAVGGAVYVSRSRSPETPSIALPAGGSESPPPQVRGSAPTATVAADPAPIEMAPQSAARPHVAVAATGADLAREVELIDMAMAALKRGDANAALDAIHTHARETRGAGQLAEDAAAIEVEALCRLHDPTTAEKLETFDAHFPRSAQRSRLGTVCK
jgi:hypothetical protein